MKPIQSTPPPITGLIVMIIAGMLCSAYIVIFMIYFLFNVIQTIVPTDPSVRIHLFTLPLAIVTLCIVAFQGGKRTMLETVQIQKQITLQLIDMESKKLINFIKLSKKLARTDTEDLIRAHLKTIKGLKGMQEIADVVEDLD